MNESGIEKCICMKPPFYFDDFESKQVGTDSSNGRFGEVSIEKCKKCGNLWIKYFVEYESFSGSGRWYRGLISEEEALKITPENAIDFLKKSDFFFYGGTFFQTDGKRGEKGKNEIIVDL